jgi:hypothetical protein
MAIYPHRGVQDCAVSVVERGGRQHCFFGSRRAPRERTEMEVGPFRLDVIEPMRRARVVLGQNPSGIECDLTFEARSAALEEGRQTLWAGTRRVMDATRFAQFGRWRGTLHYPEGRIDVDPAVCHATKDRSWGVRTVGEPEAGGAPSAPRGIFFLWAPLFWRNHVSHAIFFEGPRGEALFKEGILAPLYASAGELPKVEDERCERLADVAQRVRYVPGTRLARKAEIDLVSLGGERRTISLEPLLRFHMKGLGYQHPQWGQGFWKGELALGAESFDPEELDLLAPANVHVQQVVRASDGEEHGAGVLEQICIGAHAPSGFTGLCDGAAGGTPGR